MTDILIKNVHVLDVDIEADPSPQDILIKGDRIVEVGNDLEAPKGAEYIDAGGRFALPGLIDCHVHPFLAETNLSKLSEVPPTLMTARAVNILRGMLHRGFTTIRDATGADWGIKKAVADGEVEGPRMFIACRALSQTGGHGDFRSLTEDFQPCNCAHALAYTSLIADGEDEVRKAVREQLRQGADQIKIMVSGGVSSPHDPLECDQYSAEEIRVIVDEAKKRGTYVMAHAYGASAIRMALENGVRTIEHGNLIDEEAAQLAAEKGAYLVPTLITYDVLARTAADSGWSDEMLGKLERVRAAGLRAIELCRSAGAKIGFGTDLLGDSFDHQSEEFLIRSAIETPREIIRSATKINAEILQMTDELGVLKSGALADILILDANPFDDLNVLQNQGAHMPVILKGGDAVKNTLSN